MSMKLRSALGGLAIIMLGWFVAAQSSSRGEGSTQGIQRWQYHIEIASEITEANASALGADGWELVTVFQQHEGQFRAIFKRKG